MNTIKQPIKQIKPFAIKILNRYHWQFKLCRFIKSTGVKVRKTKWLELEKKGYVGVNNNQFFVGNLNFVESRKIPIIRYPIDYVTRDELVKINRDKLLEDYPKLRALGRGVVELRAMFGFKVERPCDFTRNNNHIKFLTGCESLLSIQSKIKKNGNNKK